MRGLGGRLGGGFGGEGGEEGGGDGGEVGGGELLMSSSMAAHAAFRAFFAFVISPSALAAD